MRQVQAKMSAFIRTIDGLGLAAQNRHAHSFGKVFFRRLAKQHIQPRGRDAFAEGEFQI